MFGQICDLQFIGQVDKTLGKLKLADIKPYTVQSRITLTSTFSTKKNILSSRYFYIVTILCCYKFSLNYTFLCVDINIL